MNGILLNSEREGGGGEKSFLTPGYCVRACTHFRRERSVIIVQKKERFLSVLITNVAKYLPSMSLLNKWLREGE